MNYLQVIFGYIIGLYVPAINSTSIILAFNSNNHTSINRLCRLQIMKVWSMLESSGLILGYYGIRSSKTTLTNSIEKYYEIDINCIAAIIISIILTVSMYLLLITLYMNVAKGLLYKVIAIGYILAYILAGVNWNLIIFLYLVGVSVISIKILRNAPKEIRSMSFSLIGIVR